jgi:predicted PolB exonuclease-like 3'-5' exonuclease
MAHKIAAPGLACRSYFYRYSNHAVDLYDVLSSFGNVKATLHEISTTLGFDGKASGVDGSHVEQMVREGRIPEVAAYCTEDVLNTYRIWLRYEYEASEEPLTQRLQEHTLIRGSSASARTPHAPGNAVVAELVDALA